jgi:hypothetical protein
MVRSNADGLGGADRKRQIKVHLTIGYAGFL